MKSRFFKKKILLFIISLSLLLFASYYVFFSSRIDTVVRGKVYRSSQLPGDLLEKFIKDKDIKAIINLRGSSKDKWYVEESDICKKYGVKLFDIEISANDLPDCGKLRNTLDILSTSEKPILIHCHKGVDRTGLVSALALAVEKDPPLSEVKQQFSWRRGVFPFYQSAGPYFFSKYEQWLDKTQRTHSKTNLLYWINNEYLDSNNNLIFWIDRVNGILCKNKKVIIPGDSKRILIDGWAFDTCTNSSVRNLYVVIDDKTSSKADFKYNRPDVARVCNLDKKYHQNFMIGWEAEFNRTTVTDGCHRISFRIVKSGSSSLYVSTEDIFCIENTSPERI